MLDFRCFLFGVVAGGRPSKVIHPIQTRLHSAGNVADTKLNGRCKRSYAFAAYFAKCRRFPRVFMGCMTLLGLGGSQ